MGSGRAGAQLFARLARLGDVGVAGRSPDDVRRIQTLNLIAGGAFFFNTSYTVLYAILDLQTLAPLVVTNLVWSLIYLGVPYLNLHGRADLASWVLVVNSWLNLTFASAFLGIGTGVYLFLLLIPMLGVLVVRPGARFQLWSILGVGTSIFVLAGLLFRRGPAFLEGTVVEQAMYVGSAGGVAIMGGAIALYYRQMLEAERERSERLLLNILPADIAERLKRGERRIADRVPQVTILVADIVGFTPMSERMTAVELVDVLDGLFSSFDDLTDQFGLEKYQTVGDAYLAVGGLSASPMDHVAAVADLALAMLAESGAHSVPGFGPIRLRIGIHAGPVVAGVIGKRKFSYEIWGDTINTASRMESQGVPGKIQVSEAVRRLLGDRYEFAPRGVVSIKGKGDMRTYFLEGPFKGAHVDSTVDEKMPGI